MSLVPQSDVPQSDVPQTDVSQPDVPLSETTRPHRQARPLQAREERGATLVIIALLMVALMGFAGIAIDGSNVYYQRAKMQVAADAGAYAGARALALGLDTEAVDAAVQELATANDASTVSWNYSADGKGVVAEVDHTFNTFFAQMYGRATMDVRAIAEAKYTPVAGADNLLPMTIPCDTPLEYGETVTLWDKNKNAPGAFGWLDWNGGSRGNSELVENIRYPSNSGYWEIGDLVASGPGVQNSAGVRNALDSWIGQSVTIPLYDAVHGNGANTEYTLCSFAEFTLTDYNFQGGDKWVAGTFRRTLQSGGTSGADVQDRGVYRLVLAR